MSERELELSSRWRRSAQVGWNENWWPIKARKRWAIRILPLRVEKWSKIHFRMESNIQRRGKWWRPKITFMTLIAGRICQIDTSMTNNRLSMEPKISESLPSDKMLNHHPDLYQILFRIPPLLKKGISRLTLASKAAIKWQTKTTHIQEIWTRVKTTMRKEKKKARMSKAWRRVMHTHTPGNPRIEFFKIDWSK